MTENNSAQAAEQDPLSDQFVNAVIRQHGYDSPEAVIARLWQWIGLNGSENGVTLLMYEAHKVLSKLRATGADERKDYCPEKRKPGGCQLHNLHCGYPKCNEAPTADTQEVPQDTGNPEADQLIGRLMSSDPDFDDCAAAARLIRTLASAPVTGEAQRPHLNVVLDHAADRLADAGMREDASIVRGMKVPNDGSKTEPVKAAPQASEAVRDVEDAERWRWATASDGNADKLCSIVLCHGGYQDKINERADFYRAALSAQPGAQRTGGSE